MNFTDDARRLSQDCNVKIYIYICDRKHAKYYRQRYNYDPYQINGQIFHRKRNFTNSQCYWQDNLSQFDDSTNQNNRERTTIITRIKQES